MLLRRARRLSKQQLRQGSIMCCQCCLSQTSNDMLLFCRTTAVQSDCVQAAAAARAANEPCPRCGWHNGVGPTAPTDVLPTQQQRLISNIHSGPEHEDKQLSLKLSVRTASAPTDAHQSGSRHTTADAASQCSAGSCDQVQEQLPYASKFDGDIGAAAADNALCLAASQPQQVVTAQGSSEAASVVARTTLQREVDRAAAAGHAAEAAATAKMSALQDAIRRVGSKSDLQQVAP